MTAESMLASCRQAEGAACPRYSLPAQLPPVDPKSIRRRRGYARAWVDGAWRWHVDVIVPVSTLATLLCACLIPAIIAGLSHA